MLSQVDIKVAPGSHADEESGEFEHTSECMWYTTYLIAGVA